MFKCHRERAKIAAACVCAGILAVWILGRRKKTGNRKKRKKYSETRIWEVSIGSVLTQRHAKNVSYVVVAVNVRDGYVVCCTKDGYSGVIHARKKDGVLMLNKKGLVKKNMKKVNKIESNEGDPLTIRGHPSLSGEYILLPATSPSSTQQDDAPGGKTSRSGVWFSPENGIALYSKQTARVNNDGRGGWRFGIEHALPEHVRRPRAGDFRCVAFTLRADAKTPPPAHPGDLERKNTVWCSDHFDLSDVIVVERASGTAKKYTDRAFPPLWWSVGIVTPANMVWKRLSVLFPNAGLVDDESGSFDPSDVDQGRIGDCYILAALAALSTRPEVIRTMLRHNASLTQPAADGKYIVELNCFGKRTIVVDDWVPCEYDAARDRFMPKCCMKRAGDEIWPAIVEKALAKFYGSYTQIGRGGTVPHAFEDLCGYPVEVVTSSDPQFDTKIRRAMRERWPLGSSGMINNTCTSSTDVRMTEALRRKMTGLLKNHAYSVLRVIDVDGTLWLLVRNPHKGNVGHRHRCGTWSDKLPSLSDEKMDAGCFWMRAQEYRRWFDFIAVCRIKPTLRNVEELDVALPFYHTNSKSMVAEPVFAIAEFQVDEGAAGKSVDITLSQMSKRSANRPYGTNTYAQLRLWVVRFEDFDAQTAWFSVNSSGCKLTSRRLTMSLSEGALRLGRYFIFADSVYKIADELKWWKPFEKRSAIVKRANEEWNRVHFPAILSVRSEGGVRLSRLSARCVTESPKCRPGAICKGNDLGKEARLSFKQAFYEAVRRGARGMTCKIKNNWRKRRWVFFKSAIEPRNENDSEWTWIPIEKSLARENICLPPHQLDQRPINEFEYIFSVLDKIGRRTLWVHFDVRPKGDARMCFRGRYVYVGYRGAFGLFIHHRDSKVPPGKSVRAITYDTALGWKIGFMERGNMAFMWRTFFVLEAPNETRRILSTHGDPKKACAAAEPVGVVGSISFQSNKTFKRAFENVSLAFRHPTKKSQAWKVWDWKSQSAGKRSSLGLFVDSHKEKK